MTEIEAQATGGYGEGTGSRSGWSQFLVPIVAAALVLALGLVWVSLTSEPNTPTTSAPASQAGVF
jgi:hypothetical protein